MICNRTRVAGNLCEADVIDCAENPCENNGTCVDQQNGFSCHCLPGFTGILCSEIVSSDEDSDVTTSTYVADRTVDVHAADDDDDEVSEHQPTTLKQAPKRDELISATVPFDRGTSVEDRPTAAADRASTPGLA